MCDCSDCKKSRLRLEYLAQDKPCPNGFEAADYDSLDIISEGCHLYGQILRPDGTYQVPRPCVILLHGFPGTARNDDLAQALRRVGCVVIVPHLRGAWGSEGNYLISHCVEDTIHLAEYAKSQSFCEKMNVDPKSIFLCGHSMGGNSALHAARRLPWLKGVVLMTPYDPTRYLLTGREHLLRELTEEGGILHSDGPEALYEDVVRHKEEFCFVNAYDDLKDQNLCFIVGSKDPVAPEEEMVTPLWSRLQAYKTQAVQRLTVFPTSHGMCDVRMALAECVGTFLSDVLQTIPENE